MRELAKELITLHRRLRGVDDSVKEGGYDAQYESGQLYGMRDRLYDALHTYAFYLITLHGEDYDAILKEVKDGESK